MAPTTKMLTAVFRDRSAATRTYEWLQERGYKPEEINVLMSDRTRQSLTTADSEGKSSRGIERQKDWRQAGPSGQPWAPRWGDRGHGDDRRLDLHSRTELGDCRTSLGSACGGGAGAVTGGLVGALIGLGIPESNAHAYEEALREGEWSSA